MNVAEEVPWCVVYQSTHSSEYCAVAQYIESSQGVEKEKNLKHENIDSTDCNMIGSGYDYESNEDYIEDNQDVVYKRLFYEGCHQQIFSEDEEEIDSKACNMLSTNEDVNLGMSS